MYGFNLDDDSFGWKLGFVFMFVLILLCCLVSKKDVDMVVREVLLLKLKN